MRVITFLIISVSLGLVFLAAVPQIGNGGFEMATTAPAATVPGWSQVSAQDAQVLGAGTTDASMPKEGSSWLTFSGAGSSNASKPSVRNGFGNPPQNVVSVGESFNLSGTTTKLEIDAAFLSNESPGSIWEDFLSIDLSDGTSSLNILLLDINTPMPQTSTLFNQTITQTGMKTTAVKHRSIDIPAYFPQATDQTTFTLTLSVGNAIDSSLPSRAYFDGVHFVTGSTIPTAIPAASIRVDALANGDWRFVADAPAWPGGIIYNIFSGKVTQPVGSGPFAGIFPDGSTYFTMNAPLGMPPFHVGLDGQGHYEFVIPAWAAPNITADCFMAVFYAGYLVELSPVVRHTY